MVYLYVVFRVWVKIKVEGIFGYILFSVFFFVCIRRCVGVIG